MVREATSGARAAQGRTTGRSQSRYVRPAAIALGTLFGGMSLFGCGKTGKEVALSRHAGEPVPEVPVPAADGPKLGATAHATPIRRRPAKDAKIIGYLHAGSKVSRAESPYSREGCNDGWYPIRPRGFVCLNEGATIDPRHPTLSTMAIQPNLDSPMPYTYARTLKDAPLYEVDEAGEQAVKQVGEAPSRSGMAIVGSWQAKDGDGNTRKLAMLTNGQFIDVTVLEEAKFSSFSGVELGGKVELPIAFVVKRGVFAWNITGPKLDRGEKLKYHSKLFLSGRYRTIKDAKFWELSDGTWARHQDITAVRVREKFPSFVTEGKKWVDVSVVMGTAVAYEGQNPVYATLVSVGRDRLGEELENARITKRGEFTIVAKHLTALNAKVQSFANRVNMYDTPWTLELSSGQLLHASYWHNRFGVEHGPGNLQFSPADARWLWMWASPIVPEGWHAVTESDENEDATIINVRR